MVRFFGVRCLGEVDFFRGHGGLPSGVSSIGRKGRFTYIRREKKRLVIRSMMCGGGPGGSAGRTPIFCEEKKIFSVGISRITEGKGVQLDAVEVQLAIYSRGGGRRSGEFEKKSMSNRLHSPSTREKGNGRRLLPTEPVMKGKGAFIVSEIFLLFLVQL